MNFVTIVKNLVYFVVKNKQRRTLRNFNTKETKFMVSSLLVKNETL